MIDEFEPSNQILQAAVCMSSPGLVRPHTWHAGMEGLLVSLRMCQNLFLAGEHMWIYCLFWEQKGTSILTNFLRGTKARVAQHPRKRLPPTSHTLEEANLGAEPSYGMGMCHKSVQMHPEKKKRRKRHTMPLCMDFFFGILDVSKCPTCADISRAHLCHVAGWWGKRSTGCRYPGAGPRLSGEGRNMARKNRGCIEIILLLGSDSINLNNQRVIQMAIFHGYVIGLIWITLWLFNIAMENGP